MISKKIFFYKKSDKDKLFIYIVEEFKSVCL